MIDVLPAVDPATDNGTVRVRIDNAKHLLKLGMFLTIDLVLKQTSTSLVVPSKRFIRMKLESRTYTKSLATRRSLSPCSWEIQTKDQAQIVSGVEEGNVIYSFRRLWPSRKDQGAHEAMNFVRVCRRNSRAVFLLVGVLTLAGLVSVFQLPSNIYPELNFSADHRAGACRRLVSDTMLVTVTRPIEEQVSTVFGVRRVRLARFVAEPKFQCSSAKKQTCNKGCRWCRRVSMRLARRCPLNLKSKYERLTPAVFPILSLVLNGNVPDVDLRDFAVYNLRPLFSRVPGAARVEVDASDVREISVVVDPQKALAHRITLPDLADRLRTTNSVVSVGISIVDINSF